MIVREVNTSLNTNYFNTFGQNKNYYYGSNEVDFFESQQESPAKESHLEFLKKKISDSFNKNKTRLWLSVPTPTLNSLKAFWNDPEAFTYEMERPLTGKVIKKEKLAEINLRQRRNKEPLKATVRKVEFDDKSCVYTIQNGIERLAFIDVDFELEDEAYINYASTIVGREKYSNLLMILMQAMTEDCMRQGFIPKITASPAEIGVLDFDRASLYKYYGADIQTVEHNYYGYTEEEQLAVVTPEKLIQKLERINTSPKRNFILPDSKSNFQKLKRNFTCH